MNFKRLVTWLTLGAAGITPLATAQNPTILQGNYVSNVFGQANFVLNPNAQTNVANVTVSSATVSRSTTTPLVATTEFTITTSSSTGYADWTTRTFDAGMKNQNCEARFTYRGFSVGTTKAQLVQNSLVVAELTLLPATDPRIASINFPCGDLANATIFRLQQSSASLTGTNEIGGIYVGLATSQANVAQAETVVIAKRSTAQSIANTTDVTVIYDTEEKDQYGEYDTSTGIFTAKRAGFYSIEAETLLASAAWTINEEHDLIIKKNGIAFVIDRRFIQASVTNLANNQVFGTVELAVGDTLQIVLYHDQGAAINLFAGSNYNRLQISRFPLSSELVVKPETQNTFAGIRGQATGGTNNVTSASWTKLTSSSTLTRTAYGKAKVETNNDYSVTVENMPVGSYLITAAGSFVAQASASGNSTECAFNVSDTANSGPGITTLQVISTGDASSTAQYSATSGLSGIYTNTSVANRTFFVNAYRIAGGGNCLGYSDANRVITITITPLDQPSNSALYVQGPVLGARTGAAIPAGYVGETKFVNVTTLTNWPGNNNYFQLSSITLEAGVWSCSLTSMISRNGATFAAVDNAVVTFSELSALSPAYPWPAQGGGFAGVAPTTFTNFSAHITPMVFRSDGSQITWPDNVARGTNVLYINGYLSNYTAGTPQYTLRAQCVRIN